MVCELMGVVSDWGNQLLDPSVFEGELRFFLGKLTDVWGFQDSRLTGKMLHSMTFFANTPMLTTKRAKDLRRELKKALSATTTSEANIDVFRGLLGPQSAPKFRGKLPDPPAKIAPSKGTPFNVLQPLSCFEEGEGAVIESARRVRCDGGLEKQTWIKFRGHRVLLVKEVAAAMGVPKSSIEALLRNVSATEVKACVLDMHGVPGLQEEQLIPRKHFEELLWTCRETALPECESISAKDLYEYGRVAFPSLPRIEGDVAIEQRLLDGTFQGHDTPERPSFDQS